MRTAATGINRPRLDAPIESKAQLLKLALGRYVTGPVGYVRKAKALTDPRWMAGKYPVSPVESAFLITTPVITASATD